MARLEACILVTGLLTCVSGLMEFINPPPFGTVGDMSNSPKYSVGDLVNVIWTPGEEGGAVSLCLYQQNETDGMWFGDMEYLTRKTNHSSLDLLVYMLTFEIRERSRHHEIQLACRNEEESYTVKLVLSQCLPRRKGPIGLKQPLLLHRVEPG